MTLSAEAKTFAYLAEAYSMAHPTMGKSPLFQDGESPDRLVGAGLCPTAGYTGIAEEGF